MTLDIGWLILQFLAAAAAIFVAGTFLTRYADALGEMTGIGQSLAGMVLLATATSLPELAVDISAVRMDPPAPNLAVGDLLGSCLFNLFILAVMDLLHSPRYAIISRMNVAHAVSGILGIALVSMAAIAIATDVPFEFLRLGPGSIAIAVGYALGIRLIYLDQRDSADTAKESVPPPAFSATQAVVGYLLATVAIVCAAPFLAHSADELARVTGLGGTFIGTTLVAATTSFPEIVTTWVAIRMGASDLAVGNILGSNVFNMLILAVVDFAYDGSLLNSVDQTHVITAGFVVLVTAVVLMALVYRGVRRAWLLEPGAVSVILLSLGGLLCIYLAGQ